MPPAVGFDTSCYDEHHDIAPDYQNDKSEKLELNENVNEDVSSFPGPGTDEIVRPRPRAIVTQFNIVCKWSTIILQSFDIVNDLYLIGEYFVGREWLHFAWTVAAVFVSSFINFFISMRLYNQNDEEVKNATYNKLLRCKYYWPIMLLFQLTPLFRSWESLKYARESRNYGIQSDRINEKKYYKKMLKEDNDIALLYLVEGTFEAAPQAILQLVIMQKQYHEPFGLMSTWQVLRIVLALGSLGLCMTNFNRIMRLVQPNKTIITTCGLVCQFVWHTSIIVSRIFSVFVVASASTTCACVWFFIHCLFMTIWIVLDRGYVAPTLKERIKLLMLDSVHGAYCFLTYVDFSDRPTLSRRTFYHALCFIQNVVACCCWAYFATDETIARWDFKFFIALCIVPYALGVLFMIVYYKLESVMKKPNHKISSNTSVETV